MFGKLIKKVTDAPKKAMKATKDLTKAVELFQVGVTLDRPFKREEKAYQGMKSYLEKL